MTRFLLVLILTSVLFSQATQAQIDEQAVRDEIEKMEGIGSLLQQFESFGKKGPGSTNLHDCAAWLMAEYKSYGYTDVRFDTFSSPLEGVNYNVLAYLKVPSATETIVIGSHYDTKGGPGVNDNGTGVAAQLLLAKQIQDKTPKRNILFIHFAGEEQGFHGSLHEAIKWQDSSHLYTYYNLDQLGGTKGQAKNMKVTCERDENNSPSTNNALSYSITEDMANDIAHYTDIVTDKNRAYSSDYEPFQSRGITITGLYQSGDYPFEHAAGDTLGNVDTNVTLAIAKGFYAHIIVSQHVLPILSVDEVPTRVSLYPNPTKYFLYFESDYLDGELNFEILNLQGNVVQKGRSSHKISLNNLTPGLYLLRLHRGEKGVIKRFLVE